MCVVSQATAFNSTNGSYTDGIPNEGILIGNGNGIGFPPAQSQKMAVLIKHGRVFQRELFD